jgi:hypothetical protein
MQPLPPPSSNTVSYRLSRQQIVGQWFRRRIFRPVNIITNAVILVGGIIGLVIEGYNNSLGWLFVAIPFLLHFSITA